MRAPTRSCSAGSRRPTRTRGRRNGTGCGPTPRSGSAPTPCSSTPGRRVPGGRRPLWETGGMVTVRGRVAPPPRDNHPGGVARDRPGGGVARLHGPARGPGGRRGDRRDPLRGSLHLRGSPRRAEPGGRRPLWETGGMVTVRGRVVLPDAILDDGV